MKKCQICLRQYSGMRFQTPNISICGRCVNLLNGNPAPACYAIQNIANKLRNGMMNRALRDIESDNEHERRRAQRTLDNFEQEHERALPRWLNKFSQGDNSKDSKLLRAYRRGILRLEGGNRWDYPADWEDRAARIRMRDGYRCALCGAEDVIIDVHHIVYLSHWGTNRQENLVSLCRDCHQNEHARIFDFGEKEEPQAFIRAPENPEALKQELAQPIMVHKAPSGRKTEPEPGGERSPATFTIPPRPPTAPPPLPQPHINRQREQERIRSAELLKERIRTQLAAIDKVEAHELRLLNDKLEREVPRASAIALWTKGCVAASIILLPFGLFSFVAMLVLAFLLITFYFKERSEKDRARNARYKVMQMKIKHARMHFHAQRISILQECAGCSYSDLLAWQTIECQGCNESLHLPIISTDMKMVCPKCNLEFKRNIIFLPNKST